MKRKWRCNVESLVQSKLQTLSNAKILMAVAWHLLPDASYSSGSVQTNHWDIIVFCIPWIFMSGDWKYLSGRNSKGLAVLRNYLGSSERLSKLIMVFLVCVSIFSWPTICGDLIWQSSIVLCMTAWESLKSFRLWWMEIGSHKTSKCISIY